MTPEKLKQGQELLAMAEHCERLSMVCAVFLDEQKKHHSYIRQGNTLTAFAAADMKDEVRQKFERIIQAAIMEFESYLNNEAAECRQSFYEL